MLIYGEIQKIILIMEGYHNLRRTNFTLVIRYTTLHCGHDGFYNNIHSYGVTPINPETVITTLIINLDCYDY